MTDMRVQLSHLMSQLENIKDVKIKKKKKPSDAMQDP